MLLPKVTQLTYWNHCQIRNSSCILEKSKLCYGLLFFIKMMYINITHYFFLLENFVREKPQPTVYSQEPSILSEVFATISYLTLNHMSSCIYDYQGATGQIRYTTSEANRKFLTEEWFVAIRKLVILCN